MAKHRQRNDNPMGRGTKVVNKIVADALEGALHEAVGECDFEVVRAILKHKQHGLNINARKDGRTPLMRAVETRCLETVRSLVEDPRTAMNAKESSGDRDTALLGAVKWGIAGMVRLLMSDPRVDPCAKDKNGDAALDIALDQEDGKCTPITDILIRDPRVDINVISPKDGSTAICNACYHLNVSNVEFLLRRPELDLNALASRDDCRFPKRWYPLEFIQFKDPVVADPHLDSTFAITKLILADARTSVDHLQRGLCRSAYYNFLPFAKVLLQSRIDADRNRLDALRRQSAAGLAVPNEVIAVQILPFLGQTIVTQDVFDTIAERSYGEFQYDKKWQDRNWPKKPGARFRRLPMIDLLTTFLLEYGNIDDFDIPIVWS